VDETDATLSSRVRVAGVFPAESHAPIRYPVAALAAHDGPAARAFLRLLDSEAAREVFRRHGFTPR
jgi:molybdate transport system substrate-binding protein